MLYPTMPPTYELPVTAPVLSQPLIALFSARPTMPLTYELPMTAPVLFAAAHCAVFCEARRCRRNIDADIRFKFGNPDRARKGAADDNGADGGFFGGRAPLEERLFSPLIQSDTLSMLTDAQPETVQALSQFATVAGASDLFVSKNGLRRERMRVEPHDAAGLARCR